jgi:hypothetical protein
LPSIVAAQKRFIYFDAGYFERRLGRGLREGETCQEDRQKSSAPLLLLVWSV